jgi:hypothetical protein
MANDSELDERLIRPILDAADRQVSERAPGDHPDEETLALFAQGALAGSERTALVRHLADCAECRQTASLVLRLSGSELAEAERVLPFRDARRWVPRTALAVAAAVLLAVVGLMWVQDGRRPAEPIALAYAGRLTDFGFEIGGVAARDAGRPGAGIAALRAQEVLNRTSGRSDLGAELNRGHALLMLGRAEEALAEFRRATRRALGEPLAWLGQGLAAFVLNDFAAAESAFRESLRLDPQSAAARLNLAMTLEELGKLDQAVTEWERLLAQPLPEAEARAVRSEIEELRQHRKQ